MLLIERRKSKMKLNELNEVFLSKILGQEIKITMDLNAFSNAYDQVIAKILLEEFGVIYYYADSLEPVEPDDIYRLLEE